ncbi:unnamed protein product [Linum tenue]|uniref:DELLA protein RGL1 n=1 Tax=Linum tenue TaxID=586396 RepID=A0AAV0S4E8_9ROSI|nr:unnamed protein product [Linum tenue]
MSSATFQLLNHRVVHSFTAEPSNDSFNVVGARVPTSLSIDETIRLAASRIVGCSDSDRVGIPSLLNVPFDPSISGLSIEDQKNVELAEYLLSSADRVSSRQYDEAISLVGLCDCLSSPKGNAVQRVVHYFARGLRERVENETGRNYSSPSSNNEDGDVLRLPSPSIVLSAQERFPYYQMQQLAAVQAMLESAASARRIHGIDLKIKSGLHWIAFMQALESRPAEGPRVEILKVTAMCTGAVEPVRATGEWLTGFAKSKGLNFCFKIVRVEDVLDVRGEMFRVDQGREAVMVYSEHAFVAMIGQPDRMETLMRVVRGLNPQLMVVTETEANNNSPQFSARFVDTLFHYGAVFDSVDACMGADDESRTFMEGGIMGRMISNIVAREGEERVIRGVKLDVWRAFFRRFEMVERRLGPVAWQQARLVHETAPNGEFCTVERDGKAMVIGWKGTPLVSVSTWKFFRSARLVNGSKHLRIEFE